MGLESRRWYLFAARMYSTALAVTRATYALERQILTAERTWEQAARLIIREPKRLEETPAPILARCP